MESKRCFATLNMTRFQLSLRASGASVAINRVEHSETVDCFGYRLAMTRGSVHKNFIVMLSVAKHLFAILIFVYFVKGDRGATCEAPPLSPLNNPPNPLTPLKCALRLYMPIVHSACVNVMPTARTLPLCAVVGRIESRAMENQKLQSSKRRCAVASP